MHNCQKLGILYHACKCVIRLSIYLISRKVCRVPNLGHQRFSDDRDGELNFSTAHRHYFCLSVCLSIILNTVALIFSIVISHGTADNKDILYNRDLLIFSVHVFCGRNVSRMIFLKFKYFSYLSVRILYKS